MPPRAMEVVLHRALIPMLLLTCCRPEGDGGEEIRTGLDRAFPEGHVVQVRLRVDGGWPAMEEAYLVSGDLEYRAASLAWDGERRDAVGLRIRGPVEDGEGRTSPKQDLRIDFNRVGGDRFHGVDRVDLIADFDDPSLLRRLLASRMYRVMDVPDGRTALAEVGVEDGPAGVYTLVQPVDARFLRAWFGRRDGADRGNLYDCVPPFCALFLRGQAKDDYVLEDCSGGEPCGWILETNVDDPARNGYQDLVELITWLNTADDAAFEAEAEERFEVDTFLRFLAVAAAIGDYDGFLDGYGDFLLYHRPDSGRWVLIPKDHDRSYGAKRCKGSDEDTGGPVLPPWCGWTPNPLGVRVLAVDAWREQYLAYVEEVARDWLTVEVHAGWIRELEALLTGPFARDPTLPFDAAAHAAAIGDGAWEDDPPGLLTYVAARRARLLEEVSR